MAEDYKSKLGKSREQVKQLAETGVGKVAQAFAKKSVDSMKEKVPTSQAGTGNLKQSIGVEFSADGDVIEIRILADDYWDFVNSGVDGYQQSSGAIQNRYGTTYSFSEQAKTQSSGVSFKESIQQWIVNKGITAEDGDYESLAFVIMQAVKRKGIRPSRFVDDTFTPENLQAFEEELLNEFEKIV